MCSADVFLLLRGSVSYLAPRDLHRRAAYSICESSFWIHQGVVVMIYLFVLDDSLTSLRFTLGACKIDLSRQHPVTLYY